MNTLGRSPARRLHLPQRVLGAVLLAAICTLAQAQGSRADIRFTLAGGDHDGEYVLTDVPMFLCGFDFSGAGSYGVQYYADDPSAAPSIIQLAHEVVMPDVGYWSAELLIGFGDITTDGVVYMINSKQGIGTVETNIVDDGDSATMTMQGTTGDGVEVFIESVCRGVNRFEDAG